MSLLYYTVRKRIRKDTHFGLCVWILKSKEKRRRAPFIASIGASAFLIVAYAASRTIRVPIVGVEYYVGRLDIVAKVLQAIVIGLSFVAIYNMKKQMSVAAENKSTMRTQT